MARASSCVLSMSMTLALRNARAAIGISVQPITATATLRRSSVASARDRCPAAASIRVALTASMQAAMSRWAAAAGITGSMPRERSDAW